MGSLTKKNMYNLISEAIEEGYSDEQLGIFVRKIISSFGSSESKYKYSEKQ